MKNSHNEWMDGFLDYLPPSICGHHVASEKKNTQVNLYQESSSTYYTYPVFFVFDLFV